MKNPTEPPPIEKIASISAHSQKINTSKKGRKRKKDALKIICWIIAPLIFLSFVLLDAVGLYIFSKERLIVLGLALIVLLLPFFSEVDLKSFTIKRGKK